MKSAEKKAASGMIRFVLTILVVAIVVAGFYLFYLTPGEVTVLPRS
jgi:hypothetical protein